MTLTRTFLWAAVCSLTALSLAACASVDGKGKGASGQRAAQAANPLELYSLKTGNATDKIALALHDSGLSPAQSDALKAFVARRAKAAGGIVTISLPHGAADAAVAARTADLAQGLLNVDGAPTQRTTYESDDAKAPLLVSFAYEKAEIPTCGKDWGELTRTKDNDVYDNFGCAVTANMAAQIANPADIDHPHAEDAPDAGRRTTVLDKYRDGKLTGAETPDPNGTSITLHVGQ
jgi:pilus assembly protein CpaD